MVFMIAILVAAFAALLLAIYAAAANPNTDKEE